MKNLFKLFVCIVMSKTVNIFFSGVKSSDVCKMKEDTQTIQNTEENKLYYRNGDTVNFTCEIKDGNEYPISWTEVTERQNISVPSHIGSRHSLTLTLDTYDSGSRWCCTIFEAADLCKVIYKIDFLTVESTSRESNKVFENNNVKITIEPFNSTERLSHITCDESKGQIQRFLIQDGKIFDKTLSNEDLCIQFIHEDPDITKRITSGYSSIITTTSITYSLVTEGSRIENESTTYPSTTVNNEKLSDLNDDIDERNLLHDNIIWIVTGGGLFFVVIIVFIILKTCRTCKKNAQAQEGLYATAGEVVYMELQLPDAGALTPRNDIPYAEVIGVLKKNKKNKEQIKK